MQRNPEYLRTRSLFVGHQAGAFTLPDDLVELNTRAARLEAESRVTRPSRKPAARGEFVNALRDAIASGTDMPDPAVLHEAEAHDRALAEMVRILVEETENAQTRVVAGVQRFAETILVDHLRPALEDTLEAATSAAEKLGRTLPTAEGILSAPDATRKAFQALGALSSRYISLRNAQGVVVELSAGARYDAANLFREFRNLPDIFPQYANPRAERPWPTTDRGRLLWIVTSAIEAWMPTPEEQDEAFADRFPNAPVLRGRAAGWTDRREVAGV